MWRGHSCPRNGFSCREDGITHSARSSIHLYFSQAGVPAPQLRFEPVQQLPCVQRPFGRLFMLEVSKHVAAPAQMLLDPVNHRRSFIGRVVWFAKAVIQEIGGSDFRRRHLLGLGYAQGGIVLLQGLVSLLAEPGRISELERRLQLARQGLQECRQHFLVSFKVRRQLKQNGTKPPGARQRFNRSEEARQKILCPLQPLNMGDDLVRFDGEAESSRRLGQPVLQGRFFDQLPEGIVHLHRIQLGCIVAQEFFLGQFLRIEIRFPAWVCPSGGACEQLRHRLLVSRRRRVLPLKGHAHAVRLPSRNGCRPWTGLELPSPVDYTVRFRLELAALPLFVLWFVILFFDFVLFFGFPVARSAGLVSSSACAARSTLADCAPTAATPRKSGSFCFNFSTGACKSPTFW